MHGLFIQGMECSLSGMMRGLQKIHWQVENYISLGINASFELTNNSVEINYLDIHEASITFGTGALLDTLVTGAYNLFDTIQLFDTLDFSLLLSLLIVIIVFVFRIFLNSFEFSLWKTKRMLGILPTKYMVGQIEEMKELIRQIS